MLQPGETIPDVTVWAGTREPISLASLVEEGPLVLFFYLFDWSST